MHLSLEQRRALNDKIRPMLGYLHRLKVRMEAKRFERDDQLYRLVATAEDAMHRLSVNTHYLSCDGGVALPRSYEAGESKAS